MPYAPPCCNDEHAAERDAAEAVCEDAGSEHQCKAEAGVLDACLDGECPAVLAGQPSDAGGGEADQQGEEVVYEDDEEDVADALEECHPVAPE